MLPKLVPVSGQVVQACMSEKQTHLAAVRIFVLEVPLRELSPDAGTNTTSCFPAARFSHTFSTVSADNPESVHYVDPRSNKRLAGWWTKRRRSRSTSAGGRWRGRTHRGVRTNREPERERWERDGIQVMKSQHKTNHLCLRKSCARKSLFLALPLATARKEKPVLYLIGTP